MVYKIWQPPFQAHTRLDRRPLLTETEIMREEGWVKVYTAQGLTEAHIVKGLLEFNGIPVDLDYEAVGPLLGITMNGLGEVRVLVPKDWKKKALELLQKETPSEESWENS